MRAASYHPCTLTQNTSNILLVECFVMDGDFLLHVLRELSVCVVVQVSLETRFFNVQGARTRARREVEHGVAWDARPFTKVSRIRQRNTARNDPRLDLRLSRHVSRP